MKDKINICKRDGVGNLTVVEVRTLKVELIDNPNPGPMDHTMRAVVKYRGKQFEVVGSSLAPYIIAEG